MTPKEPREYWRIYYEQQDGSVISGGRCATLAKSDLTLAAARECGLRPVYRVHVKTKA